MKRELNQWMMSDTDFASDLESEATIAGFLEPEATKRPKNSQSILCLSQEDGQQGLILSELSIKQALPKIMMGDDDACDQIGIIGNSSIDRFVFCIARNTPGR